MDIKFQWNYRRTNKVYRSVNHSMTYLHVISNRVGPDFYPVTRTPN